VRWGAEGGRRRRRRRRRRRSKSKSESESESESDGWDEFNYACEPDRRRTTHA
jgi:hypothetical protein